MRFTNIGTKRVVIPFTSSPGKGLPIYEQLYLSSEESGPVTSGADFARIDCGWSAMKTGRQLTEYIDMTASDLTLEPGESNQLSVPLPLPSSKGGFRLTVRFDNRDLQRTIYSNNIVGTNYAFFCAVDSIQLKLSFKSRGHARTF
ncbi:MAG TPA: hypothetical protein V6C72_07360 [Chroococcales cyanobacterium]